ncbi:signal peptidase I [Metabacillus litoralis]|nr:signal peptidase I [Metabacillus litoralis]
MQFDKDTVDLLLSTIRKYGWMDLPSHGTSMYPFIKKGNICRFTQFNEDTVRKGDVLLYYSTTGQLIAHRFIVVKKNNKENKTYILKGDTNICSDEPINKDQIIGTLVSISNSRKKVYTNKSASIIWGFIIRTFPFISKLLRYYLSFKFSTKSGVSA